MPWHKNCSQGVELGLSRFEAGPLFYGTLGDMLNLIFRLSWPVQYSTQGTDAIHTRAFLKKTAPDTLAPKPKSYATNGPLTEYFSQWLAFSILFAMANRGKPM